jgi:hypothetical protein
MTSRSGKGTTTAKGLGWRHQQAAAALKRGHVDGSACEWCGRPMYRDRTQNWDYKREGSATSGTLHADHRDMSRHEALRRGLPVPMPNRLLHGVCNIQRGSGGNDHLAAGATGVSAPDGLGELVMDWPWSR